MDQIGAEQAEKSRRWARSAFRAVILLSLLPVFIGAAMIGWAYHASQRGEMVEGRVAERKSIVMIDGLREETGFYLIYDYIDAQGQPRQAQTDAASNLFTQAVGTVEMIRVDPARPDVVVTQTFGLRYLPGAMVLVSGVILLLVLLAFRSMARRFAATLAPPAPGG